MKLMTFPGACSTAAHIALQWTRQPFQVEIVTLEKLRSGEFMALNPAGEVPVLVDGDYVLNQNLAILTYIGERYPRASLFGDGGPKQRTEAMRWLALGNTDMHPLFGVMFVPGKLLPDPAQHGALRATTVQRLRRLFETANAQLEGKDWIAGFRSAADAYLYVMSRWATMLHIDLSGMDHLDAFKRRMEMDEGVCAALEAEGLTAIAA